jgi:hypothetical protein
MTAKDPENREECTAAERPDALSPIRTQVRICLAEFQSLLDSLDKADDDSKQKVETRAIEDQRDCFRTWLHKVRLHPEQTDAPEYRLDLMNPVIYAQVIEDLGGIQTILNKMSDIVTGKRLPWEDLSPETDEDTKP